MHLPRLAPPLRASLCLLALVTSGFADDTDPKPPAFELVDGDRVVFLGNTLIERMARYGYVEAALTARWPDRDITFRNLGWSGDTVWAESRGLFDAPAKGYERMLDHVGRLKPTVIFVAYGNVEAFAGEKGLPEFTKQYERLLDDLTKRSAEGIRFVLLGPMQMDFTAPSAVDVHSHNDTVDAYAEAVREIADDRGQRFLDLTPLTRSTRPDSDKTLNGIHLLPTSYLRLATLVTHQPANASFTFPPGFRIGVEGTVESETKFDVRSVTRIDSGFRVVAVPERVTPHITLALDGPADRVVQALEGGRRYKGSVVPFFRNPNYDALRAAIVEKNRLYFQRWRPQNVTYIELFRKHEQGRFAKDAAVYEKLVAEQEAEIAKLRKPVARTYELIRVKPDEKE